MIDSTNPRVMADNIRHLNASALADESAISENATAISANALAITANATNISKLQTYSSEEIDTGKVWIDGRKIYSRVFTGTTPADNTATTVISTADLGIVDIITMYSAVYSASSGIYRPCTGSTVWYLDGANPGIRVYATSASYQDLPLIVILEYTKEAAPSPEPEALTSPSPEDETRSNEDPEISDPIERSEEPSDEIIEEPIVETKTTRKRSTSTK